MQTNRLICGVDVAKAELAVASNAGGGVQTVGNEPRAVRAWLCTLPKHSIVAMEASGKYHQLLAQLAHQAGMCVYVLNAADVFFYSKALGTRGKTDRVDALVIARYAAEHHARLHQWKPVAARYTSIDELLRRRAVVVTKRDSLRQTLGGLKDLAVARKQLDQAFQAMLCAIDAKLDDLIAGDPELAAAQKRLDQVPGFGPVGSTLLAALLARIPFASADALVAYCGLDPRPRDSGQMHGKRRISKRGPAYLRKQWYLAGFSASGSKLLKPLYQALRARGFASTEAFLILGRKLLRAAFAVWKTGRAFDPRKLLGNAQPA